MRGPYSIFDLKAVSEENRYKTELATARFRSGSPAKAMSGSMELLPEDPENEDDDINGTRKDQVKQQSNKINKLISRVKGKISNKCRPKDEKFEDKMKIFGRLSTFIDAKSIFQEMNAMNQINPKRNSILSFKNRMEESKSTIKDPQSDFSKKVKEVLEKARSRISQKDSENQTSRRKNQSYYDFVKIADKKMQKDYDIHLDTEESSDTNFFYNKLETDMLKGKYEHLDLQPLSATEDEKMASELQHLQMLLEEGTKVRLVSDKNYYDDFRMRAKKITSLVKQAAVKIFHKKSMADVSIGKEAPATNQTVESDPSNDFWALTSVPTSNQRTVTEQIEELHQKLDNVSARLKTEHRPAVYENRQKRVNLLERIPYALAKQESKLLRKIGSLIVDDIEGTDRDFREIKNEMSKKIDQLEEFEELEMERLKEDPEASLKIHFGTKGHFASFANNPRRQKFSKKTFVVLFGK